MKHQEYLNYDLLMPDFFNLLALRNGQNRE